MVFELFVFPAMDRERVAGVGTLHSRVAPASLTLETFAWATACVGSRAYRVRGAPGQRVRDAAAYMHMCIAALSLRMPHAMLHKMLTVCVCSMCMCSSRVHTTSGHICGARAFSTCNSRSREHARPWPPTSWTAAAPCCAPCCIARQLCVAMPSEDVAVSEQRSRRRRR